MPGPGEEQAMSSNDAPEQKPEAIDHRRLALSLLGFPIFFALFLVLPPGDWLWPKGCLFILAMLVLGAACLVYLLRVNPEVITARINAYEGTKPWDMVLLTLFFLTGLGTIPVAALDDGRFHW